MAKYKLRKLEFKTFCNDKWELKRIYEQYKPVVTGLLRYRFPKMDDASIQESYDLAMLEVFRKASEEYFSSDRSLCNIIERIAFCKLDDIYRKEKKHITHLAYGDVPWEGNWERAGVEETLSSSKAMRDGVFELVLNLEWPCDKVLSLRYFENVKWKAIAALVNGKQESKSIHYWHNKCLNLMKAVLLRQCPEVRELYS